MVSGETPRKDAQQQEKTMKVKTNIRAGYQNRNRGADDTSSSSSSSTTTVVYYPPVTRCVGV